MPPSETAPSLETALLAVFAFMTVAALLAFSRFFRRAKQGEALIRTGLGGRRVSFTGMLRFPVLQQSESMDLTVKRVHVAFRDAESLTTRDGIDVEIVAAFLVRIALKQEDIFKVADAVGASKAGDPNTLSSLFLARFSEALTSAVQAADFELIDQQREEFRSEILRRIGPDLEGYTLDSIALDHFGKRDWTAN